MNKTALFVSGVLLSALACAPAVAETVRVRVSARVTHVVDVLSLLQGRIVPGQELTGTYVYDTNTPDQSPTPDVGQYQPYANEAGMRFESGGLVFENVQPTQQIYITVQPPTASSAGAFVMASFQNVPLLTGAMVGSMMVRFYGDGSVMQSTALPSAGPGDLDDYSTRQVRITGNGASFTVLAEIETAELLPPGAITE